MVRISEIIKSVIKSVENEWIKNKWGSTHTLF